MYGRDYRLFTSTGLDMDPTFTEIFGKEVVAQHVLCRWLLEPGEMDDEHIGTGLLRWLNSAPSEAELGELQSKLKNAAMEVDGVEDITLSLTLTAGQITIVASIQVDQGDTFQTVFALSATTISMIVDGTVS